MIEAYRCQNPACDCVTMVETRPATRSDPADSTWGDGCAECGDELQASPDMDAQDLAYEAAIERAEYDAEWDDDPLDNLRDF